MVTRFLALTMTGLLAFAFEAAAREAPAPGPETTRLEAFLPLQLAQVRDVEIYYDRYGREVLVDAYTGEVLVVRDPPARDRRYLHERRRGERMQERNLFDELEDLLGMRRDQRRQELGRSYPSPERLPQYRDYRALPDEDYGGYDDGFGRDDPWLEDDIGRAESWPEAPRQQQLPAPERVERAPLTPAPEIAGIPRDAGQPSEIIIEEAPATGLPDVTQQPAPTISGASEDVAGIQILLDRMGASPGVIDGRMGDNVNKAITAYRELTGETLRTYDKDYVAERLQATGGDAFTTYEITALDVAGPFVASVPADYGEKAQMERLSFTSVAEMLAERFHMDERYLRALNPGVDFNRPGTLVRVANIGKPKAGKVTRIEADKSSRQVRAYGEDGRLVAAYPATIGSTATPSPTGAHTVERIALDPEYTYNPRINFQQGGNTRVLTIPPGPNGPVGTVWIGLSKPTYGIHGTPEPSKIGKTESNGCIRLTNWDAQELAKMVGRGVTVTFVE